MTRSRPLAALIAAAALAACSAQETTRTGFLATSSQTALATDAEDAAALSFAQPAARLASYRAVIIEPIAFRPGAATPAAPDPDTVRGLSVAYRASLAEAFAARGFAIAADEAGAAPGTTLRIRAALTGFERANVPLNILTTLIIAPVTAGGAASEAEVVDAVTGERLVALATHSNGTPFLGGPHNYFLEHGHARAALARHAASLAAKVPARQPEAGQ